MSTDTDADEKSPIDKTLEISQEFKQTDSGPGGMSFSGLCGFHTYFKGDEDGDVRYGTQTALHQAFEDAFMELHVGPRMVEEEHGEFTPETAAEELAMQLQEFFHIETEFGWGSQLVEEFENNLREYQRQAKEAGDE